jgi:hypothetical protein
MPVSLFEHGSHNGEDADEAALTAFLEGDDDESDDAEFLPFLPLPLPFGGGRRATPPFVPPGALSPSGSGVQTGRIETPRGSATFRLPEPLVTQAQFKEAISKLEQSVNGVSAQLSSQISNNQKQVQGQIRTISGQHRALARATKSALARIRKEQRSQATTSMITTMLLMQGSERRLEGHKHLVGGDVDKSTLPEDNSMFALLLPSLLGDKGGDDGMLTMIMMMTVLPSLMK